MSKNKGAAGSPSALATITSSSSPSSSSLMSPRLEGLQDEVTGTPTSGSGSKKKPWQKFEPSPRCESPGTYRKLLIITEQKCKHRIFCSTKICLRSLSSKNHEKNHFKREAPHPSARSRDLEGSRYIYFFLSFFTSLNVSMDVFSLVP